jgi:hypothetical protein
MPGAHYLSRISQFLRERGTFVQKVLGGGYRIVHIAAMPRSVSGYGKRNLRVGQRKVNLLSVAEGVCKEHGVDLK